MMLSVSLLAYEVMKNDEKVCWFDVMKNYETWIWDVYFNFDFF